MKKGFLILAIQASLTNLFSQNLSIELSIEWKKEACLLTDISLIKNNNSYIPYLSIAYRNNGDDPVYFLKPTKNNKGFPPIISTILTSLGTKDRIPHSFLNFSGKNYYVYIYNSPDCGKLWEVTSDTNILSQPHSQEFINEEIFEIQQLFHRQSIYNTDTIVDCPSQEEDMQENELLARYKSNFIFLKNCEVYTERYNLIGFYVLGGNFEFGIHPNYLHDSIEGDESWDKDKQIWVYKKIALPKLLNGYKLYSGFFLSNTVSLKAK